MSIIRKRSAAQKSYIPSNARDNQYILAEFALTDELLSTFSPLKTLHQHTSLRETPTRKNYYDFYQNLSTLFFEMTEKFELENCQFIANDKMASVRFSQEMHQWQTNQQILFYYNPESHQLKKSFFDANIRAKKINLLFLSTGYDIRMNAAAFHSKVSQLVQQFCEQIALDCENVRIRDHQHITYDLFAKQKSILTTQAHKLRPINRRYESQKVMVPRHHSAMTYAIINLPVTNSMLNLVEVDPDSTDPYNPLYTFLTDCFTQAAKRYNLNNGALIANGLVPIVRYSIHEIVSRVGELQMLGYNPEQQPCGLISKWSANELTDNVQLVFVATQADCEQGFARFLNQIEQAMRLLATELEMEPTKDEMIMRFHQHIAYNY